MILESTEITMLETKLNKQNAFIEFIFFNQFSYFRSF